MLEFNLLNHLQMLILPPGSLLILAAFGLVLIRYSIRWGVIVLGVALTLLYLLSTHAISGALARTLEDYAALTEEQIKNTTADAIVVLAGGRLYAQPEYGGDTVSKYSLHRLRYAAWLKRRTNLPLYVSGGSTKKGGEIAESELMRDVLQKEFNVPVYAVENRSKTTYENAKYSAELLSRAGHQTVLLVTTTFHLPRAVEAFEQFGIHVIPAPTVFHTKSKASLIEFLPSGSAMSLSSVVFHEIIGRMWYRLRYY